MANRSLDSARATTEKMEARSSSFMTSGLVDMTAGVERVELHVAAEGPKGLCFTSSLGMLGWAEVRPC